MNRLIICSVIIYLIVGCGSGNRMRIKKIKDAELKGEEKQVVLQIDGKVWQQVADFSQSGPNDKHYLVVDNKDGTASIRFGDGEHGRRLPSGKHDFTVTYRSRKNYSGILMQEGRVILDNDWNERPAGIQRCVCGIYRAIVINNQDPLGKSRLKVQIPDATGTNPIWAQPCLTEASISIPKIGDGVWIVFEQGNANSPVWIGRME